jgi:hypothetical protein
MNKLALLLLMGAGAACAQPVQNMDIFLLWGPSPTSDQRLPGAGVTVNGTMRTASAPGYGYQIARKSAATFWLELVPMFANNGLTSASIPGVVNTDLYSFTLGGRVMVPVQSRISPYGVVAGGYGRFDHAVIHGDSVTSYSTTHGVFVFGGGIDIRIVRLLSLRGEIRDVVSGRNLSGSSGRHHTLPLMGVAFHF